MHKTSTCTQSIYTETSRIAEKIKHPTASRIFAYQRTIVPLVKEKAGLLPLFPVDNKFPSIFKYRMLGYIKPILSVQIPIYQIQSSFERSSPRTFVIHCLQSVSNYILKGF